MNFFVQRSELRDRNDRVAVAGRIFEAAALRPFESKALNSLGGAVFLIFTTAAVTLQSGFKLR